MPAIFLLLALVTPGLASAFPPDGVRTNVFVDDNRVTVDHRLFPWSTVGRLVAPSGAFCTATLVGRDFILTAAHCVAKAGAAIPGEHWFYPAYARGPGPLASRVRRFSWGTADARAEPGQDWAIGQLERPLGDVAGFLGVERAEGADLLRERVYQLGGYSGDYSGGEVASRQSGCRFTALAPAGQVLHNCSVSQGASGAAFFFESANGFMVVALATSEFGTGDGRSLLGIPYADEFANVALPSRLFYEELARLKAGSR